jgi:predicted TIM-barrel fold metal-dependent hydrolase
MLGSDFPFGSSPLEHAVQFVMDAGRAEAEREQVLGANAVRVLGLRVALLADGFPARR